MKTKLADAADAFTVNVFDENGQLSLSIRFATTQQRDAAIKALQAMLDDATSVKRL